MPREFAAVNVAIWSDPDFLALPPAAQHLYFTLWTSPALSYCGVHDWRPGRLAARSRGFTAEHIETVSQCLVARHFFVVDDATEEVLIRSWARFDGLMKQPRMAVSYATAYASVASQTIRSVLSHETAKIAQAHPELTCWTDKRVSQILDHPKVSAKDLPTPEDPFGDDLASGLALGLAQTLPKVSPSVCTPPTPSPTPAPNSSTPRAARKRALPEDFKPSSRHIELADELGVDLRAEWPQFVDHQRANNKTMADWDAALRTWIRNAPKFQRGRPATRPALHLAPNGEPIIPFPSDDRR